MPHHPDDEELIWLIYRTGDEADEKELRRLEQEPVSVDPEFDARIDAFTPDQRRKLVEALRGQMAPLGLVLSDADERTISNWVDGTLDYRSFIRQLGGRLIAAVTHGKNAI